MGIGDRLIEAVGEKSWEVSEKITQKYGDHLGEDLSKKQADLDAPKNGEKRNAL